MALSAVAVLALLVSIPYGAQAAPLSQVAPSVASTVLLSGTYSNFILDPFRDRVYVADSGNGRIIVWNTTTDRLIANVTVGGTPLGMDVSADGSQLYVALTSILSLGIVDLTTLKSVGSFRLTATPIDVAAGRMGRAYVTTNEYWGYPRILDTANRKEIGNITAGGQVYGASGGALARITRDRSTLYVGTRGLSPEDLYKFSVTSDSVSLLSHAPFNLIGANLGDADVSLDGRFLYVACGGPSGSGYYVQGLSAGDWSTVATLNTGPYPNSVSLDQRAWIAFTAQSSAGVYAFNTTTGMNIGSFAFSQSVKRVRTVPTGTKIYALTTGAGDKLEMVPTGFSPTPGPPPVVHAIANATSGYAPLSVSFTATAVLGTPPFNFSWRFGDGRAGFGAGPSHVYATPGSYMASVTARDSTGSLVSDSVKIVAYRMPDPNPLLVARQIAGLGFGVSNFYVPPDPQVAAGPDHIVEMVNLRVMIASRDGTLVQDETMQDFFRVPQSEFLSDPKLQFDGLSNRWFATIFDLSRASVLLAVSSSADPTQRWNVHAYASARGCPDQPILGVAAQVVMLSTNDFTSCQASGTYAGAEYWIINKTGLVQNSSNDFVQRGPDPSLVSVHPVQGYENASTAYMVSVGTGESVSKNVTVFRVTGVPPRPVDITPVPLVIRPFVQPPKASQRAASYRIDTGDARVQDAFVDRGSLWVAFGASCDAGLAGINRSCLRILEIGPVDGVVRQDFDIFDVYRDLFYPALRTDSSGDLLIVFGASSAAEYPSLMASSHLASDAPNTFRAPVYLRQGSGTITLGCPDGITCRYGDYFGAARDPMDPSLIWVVGEHAGFTDWSTWIAGIGTFPQVLMTVSYSILGGGTASGTPRIQYFTHGSPAVESIPSTPTTISMDRDSVWSLPGLLPGSTGTERWMTTSSTEGRANPAPMDLVYRHQYQVRVEAGTAGGTVGQVSGWRDAGSVVNLTATATPGWRFVRWEGQGPGAYGGNANPFPWVVSGASTETARFAAALRISAGEGGTVDYSYANITGVVASGTEVIIYVAPGTDVHLEASPAFFNRFASWSGGVAGTGRVVSFRVDAPANASAVFSFDVSASSPAVTAGTSILVVLLIAVLVVVVRRRRKRPRPQRHGTKPPDAMETAQSSERDLFPP
jgi:YVTN family beta-propeller protein